MPLTDIIPNPFGGFAPFPNSIMIPFMGTQSAVLGYQFGLNYEAGKRMVKSMPNEQFNKLVRDKEPFNFDKDGKPQLLLDHLANTHWHEQMKNFQSNIPSALILQDNIIEASVAIELKKANRTPSAVAEILQAFGSGAGKLLVETMNRLSETERKFIFLTVPLVGVLYTLSAPASGGFPEISDPPLSTPIPDTDFDDPTIPPQLGTEPFEHTDIVGHEQHPFHPDNEPISDTETKTIYPYDYLWAEPSDSSWRWDTNQPVTQITSTISSLTQVKSILDKYDRWLVEPLPGGISNARKNTIVWNIFQLRTSHHKATGQWL